MKPKKQYNSRVRMRLSQTKLRLPLLALLTALPTRAFAIGLITDGIEGCDFQTGVLQASCIPNFIAYVIELIFGLIGVICLVTIMYAGYEIAIGSATGDTTGGKQRLTYALIGLVVCICAFLIVDFVVSALING